MSSRNYMKYDYNTACALIARALVSDIAYHEKALLISELSGYRRRYGFGNDSSASLRKRLSKNETFLKYISAFVLDPVAFNYFPASIKEDPTVLSILYDIVSNNEM